MTEMTFPGADGGPVDTCKKIACSTKQSKGRMGPERVYIGKERPPEDIRVQASVNRTDSREKPTMPQSGII